MDTSYNNHTTSSDRYWWSHSEVMFMKRKAQLIHQFEHDARFYRNLNNVGVSLDGPEYKMYIDYITKNLGI